jgi:hypothetical protein
MKQTTQKHLKWLLSKKPEKLKKRIEKIRKEFMQMIFDESETKY